MIKHILTISSLLFTSLLMAQATRMEVKSLPSYHASESSIYAAGSFNGWNPQDEQYKFKKDEKGNYYLELKLTAGTYEYKITRGGWDKGECKKGGAAIENRKLVVPTGKNIELAIEEWQDRIPPKPKVSTASKNVHIIDTAFWIPQLKRTRRIWIYLPEEYAAEKKKRFPVLYMHDGQNVFDEATSYAGEWGVDEFLDTAIKSCIVIAIDNGDSKRMNEYCPYDFALYPKRDKENKGEGALYADFLAKTLKPFIDKKYRTRKDKKNTFIAGSSMGGLISLYTVLKYPKIFGGAGIFSPSIWICKPEMLDLIKATGKKVNSHLYFYCGKAEGEGMVPDMLLAFEKMAAVSKSKMTVVIRDEGMHNERTWRKEFPLFYTWINP